MESIPKSLKITLITLIAILAATQIISMWSEGGGIWLFKIQCTTLLIWIGVMLTQFLNYKQQSDQYFSWTMNVFLFVASYLIIAWWLAIVWLSEEGVTTWLVPELLKVNATLSVILIAVLIGYHISKTEKIVDKY